MNDTIHAITVGPLNDHSLPTSIDNIVKDLAHEVGHAYLWDTLGKYGLAQYLQLGRQVDSTGGNYNEDYASNFEGDVYDEMIANGYDPSLEEGPLQGSADLQWLSDGGSQQLGQAAAETDLNYIGQANRSNVMQVWLLRLQLMCFITFFILISLTTANGIASCGKAGTPGYGDITLITITQTGCGSTLTPGSPDTLACSKYWVTFTKDLATEYSQYNLEDAIGDYRLNASLADAQAILRANTFFDLNPPEQTVPTDTTSMSVTAWYCAIARSLKVYSAPPAKPSIELSSAKLFTDFRDLITTVGKVKLDDHPHVLSQEFDPWY